MHKDAIGIGCAVGIGLESSEAFRHRLHLQAQLVHLLSFLSFTYIILSIY